jgi:hypothetical protein
VPENRSSKVSSFTLLREDVKLAEPDQGELDTGAVATFTRPSPDVVG